VTDDPSSIINEYLELIREKLPESIAGDVITELETYMLEAARDQGDNNEITLESAKKVVAQFGAPGEVADEYRYSMLPETIPEEDIPGLKKVGFKAIFTPGTAATEVVGFIEREIQTR